MAAAGRAASPEQGGIYPRYPHYPQADSPFPNRSNLAAFRRGRKGGGSGNGPPTQGRSAQGRRRRAPPRTLAIRGGKARKAGRLFGPASFEKGERKRLRPRCEPLETAALHGLPDPKPGAERGFIASLRNSGRAARTLCARRDPSRPARDGLATRRRQSRLGQVGAGGNAGPHHDSGAWASLSASSGPNLFNALEIGACGIGAGNWCLSPISPRRSFAGGVRKTPRSGRRPIIVRKKGTKGSSPSRPSGRFRLAPDQAASRILCVLSALCAKQSFAALGRDGGSGVNPKR